VLQADAQGRREPVPRHALDPGHHQAGEGRPHAGDRDQAQLHGRFEVCHVIIKALDEGWLFPYPGGELRMLASEHRVQRRFQDALNIYRRLLDSTENEGDRAQLQELINDTIDAIQRAKAAGESPEGGRLSATRRRRNSIFAGSA